ncbi:hypothetical protein NA78x_006003 [Anatilimnocola sp. NA78]|uniref:hypothetical protein n=1 Tax=Anatilimnocola sp. NA78 TaxID=3415683 RepID=UPI003CE57A65
MAAWLGTKSPPVQGLFSQQREQGGIWLSDGYHENGDWRINLDAKVLYKTVCVDSLNVIFGVKSYQNLAISSLEWGLFNAGESIAPHHHKGNSRAIM